MFVSGSQGVVMNPKGMIAHKERDLLVTATLLMLIIVIPVLIITCVFAWRYRASNTKAKYLPNWHHSYLAESIWWGLPFIIIIILSVMVWKSSFELDPFRPLKMKTKAITIQVVALNWKWLFIYPEQKIAAINYVQFPVDTPINFEITADAPMNSFWIPQLSGQVYAMPGMKSKLHIIANEMGSFRGSSSNLSGKGFSGMIFTAKSSSQEEFDQWVEKVQESGQVLNLDEYNKLEKQSINNPVAVYSLQDEDLFNQIVMKFMMPMP